MSLTDTLISSLTISTVTVLAWLAYRHNHAFRKIYPFLYGSTILAVACFISFSMGVSSGFKSKDITSIFPLIMFLFAIVNAYLGLLYYLPNLIKKDDKYDKPN